MPSSQCSSVSSSPSQSSSRSNTINNESLMLSPPRENKQRRRLIKTSDDHSRRRRKESSSSTASASELSTKPKLTLKRKNHLNSNNNNNNGESSSSCSPSSSSKKLKHSTTIEDNDDMAQILIDDENGKENKRPQNVKASSSSRHAEPSSSLSSSEPETCIICLCEMSYPLAKLNHCTHKFCHACIDMWRKKSNTCPVCKARFTSLRVFENKETSTYKVIPVRKKVFEITPEEMVNGFYRNERDDYEEDDETFINDDEEFDGFIDENGELYLGEAQEDPRYSLRRHTRGNGDEPENSEDEEDDDANASDADEHGNLAGFVEEDPNAPHTNDDESFVLNEDDEDEEEDFELSQVSLVDEHDSTIVATPERPRNASPFRKRPNNQLPHHVIDISSPNENASRKSNRTAPRNRIINVEEEENNKEEEEVIEEDDVTVVVDPNEIQEIIEIL
ncbi:hypothetical protein FDP41_011930 [Naegleria fowleri]|uniref:RING-type domain-containing protein n=1 Tax=Naegleria fowleri TaxID=5763 RepID=A0A6A5C9Y2_NAEFO|nr:uncharacterized protein FDP41_011930 [Naegleria fowleri]KAF0982069.1 hypothetical protein FDP41_011930 [Naegleria fowleri]CAG4712151.1 unnamed protein product [Naegleria fowleri]